MIHNTLQEQFGFDDFLKDMKEVIEQVVAGASAVAVFPIGAGKSL